MKRAALLLGVAALLAGCQLGGDDGGTPSEVTSGARLEVFDGVPEPRTAKPEVGPKARIVTCGPTKTYCPGAPEPEPTRTYYYVFIGRPDLTNADFDLGETRQDFDSNTGEPIVLLRFTSDGGERFHQLTRRLAKRGSLVQLAIVVDGELVAAPAFDPRENPDGIDPSAGVQISGLASLQETRSLAGALRQSSR
jgi:hypothetical protein